MFQWLSQTLLAVSWVTPASQDLKHRTVDDDDFPELRLRVEGRGGLISPDALSFGRREIDVNNREGILFGFEIQELT